MSLATWNCSFRKEEVEMPVDMPIKILLVTILFALPLVPTFWAIKDIPKRRFASSRAKMVWFAFVASVPFVGAMFYILLGRRNTQAALSLNTTLDSMEVNKTDA